MTAKQYYKEKEKEDEKSRKSIGLYSKLKVSVAVPEKFNKEVLIMLMKKKYTFSKVSTKLKGILFSYAIKVDSIDEAHKLKKRIEKIYHKVKTNKTKKK